MSKHWGEYQVRKNVWEKKEKEIKRTMLERKRKKPSEKKYKKG
jgi:hypothetical protein